MEGTKNKRINGWEQKWTIQNNNKISNPLIRQKGKDEFSELFPDVMYQEEYDMIFQIPQGFNPKLVLQKENEQEVVDGLKIQSKKVKDCLLVKVNFKAVANTEDNFKFCFVLYDEVSNTSICKLTSSSFQVKQFLKRERQEEESNTEKVFKLYKEMKIESRGRLLSVLRQKYNKEDLKKFSRTM